MCAESSYLHYVAERLEENNVIVLYVNVSSYFALCSGEKSCVYCRLCSDPDVSQQWQCQQRPSNYKSLHSFRQNLTSTLYRFFNESMNSKFTPRTNSRISIFLHYIVKRLGTLIKKVNLAKFEMFHFLSICKEAAIFQFRKDQPVK